MAKSTNRQTVDTKSNRRESRYSRQSAETKYGKALGKIIENTNKYSLENISANQN